MDGQDNLEASQLDADHGLSHQVAGDGLDHVFHQHPTVRPDPTPGATLLVVPSHIGQAVALRSTPRRRLRHDNRVVVPETPAVWQHTCEPGLLGVVVHHLVADLAVVVGLARLHSLNGGFLQSVPRPLHLFVLLAVGVHHVFGFFVGQIDVVILECLKLKLLPAHLIAATQHGDLAKLPLGAVQRLLHLEAHDVAGRHAVDVFALTPVRLGEHVEPGLAPRYPECHASLDSGKIADEKFMVGGCDEHSAQAAGDSLHGTRVEQVEAVSIEVLDVPHQLLHVEVRLTIGVDLVRHCGAWEVLRLHQPTSPAPCKRAAILEQTTNTVVAVDTLAHLDQLLGAGLRELRPNVHSLVDLLVQVGQLGITLLESPEKVFDGILLEVVQVRQAVLVEPLQHPRPLRGPCHRADTLCILSDLCQATVQLCLDLCSQGQGSVHRCHVDHHPALIDLLIEDPQALLFWRQITKRVGQAALGVHVLNAIIIEFLIEIPIFTVLAVGIGLGAELRHTESVQQVRPPLVLQDREVEGLARVVEAHRDATVGTNSQRVLPELGHGNTQRLQLEQPNRPLKLHVMGFENRAGLDQLNQFFREGESRSPQLGVVFADLVSHAEDFSCALFCIAPRTAVNDTDVRACFKIDKDHRQIMANVRHLVFLRLRLLRWASTYYTSCNIIEPFVRVFGLFGVERFAHVCDTGLRQSQVFRLLVDPALIIEHVLDLAELESLQDERLNVIGQVIEQWEGYDVALGASAACLTVEDVLGDVTHLTEGSVATAYQVCQSFWVTHIYPQ